VKQAKENSVRYRQKLTEWEKKAVAAGHPELVRRGVRIKKSASTPRASAVRPKVKPASKGARTKAAATKPKTRVKKASMQTSKPAVAKTTTSRIRKKTVTVEE